MMVNTGVMVRWIAGVALLVYAAVAYLDHGGARLLLPAVVGGYLLVRGFVGGDAGDSADRRGGRPVNDGDVGAFDRRAASYDMGWLGTWHRRLAGKVAGIVAGLEVAPQSVLDVGCGTGQLLRALAASLPPSTELVGVDPAPAMVTVASSRGDVDGRGVRFLQAPAEELPFADGCFEVLVSSVSFDHWADQQAGLLECARVLDPGGALVLADLFAGWLAPTTLLHRRERARTPRRVERLLVAAGLAPQRWQRVENLGPLPLVQAVIATRPQKPAASPDGSDRS
jgi:ubiquinone/menaquinone biosynthesis C-methylase UbiE